MKGEFERKVKFTPFIWSHSRTHLWLIFALFRWS